MRTTVTLDEDVAALLQKEVRKSGEPFKQILNRYLRLGFTASKQPWVVIPTDTPFVPEYYDREIYWPSESLARRLAILPQIEAYQTARQRAPS